MTDDTPLNHDERVRQFHAGWALTAVVLVVQLLLLALLQFGDFGFDHPGRFGLNYIHLLLLLITYCFVLLFGLACAVSEKKPLLGLLQLIALLLVWAYNEMPPPRYDARDYQYLVGRTQQEVESTLSSRGVSTGFQGHPGGDLEFVAYRGMTVYYDTAGTVVAIQSEGVLLDHSVP